MRPYLNEWEAVHYNFEQNLVWEALFDKMEHGKSPYRLFGIQPGAVKLVLWHHLMHEIQVHPVTSENQFHCTRLYCHYSDHFKAAAKKLNQNGSETTRQIMVPKHKSLTPLRLTWWYFGFMLGNWFSFLKRFITWTSSHTESLFVQYFWRLFDLIFS